MAPPRGIHVTGPEAAAIRRELLTVQHQVETLRTMREGALIASRLETVIYGIEYLIERAEERGTLH